jgi:hypothetical protein
MPELRQNGMAVGRGHTKTVEFRGDAPDAIARCPTMNQALCETGITQPTLECQVVEQAAQLIFRQCVRGKLALELRATVLSLGQVT